MRNKKRKKYTLNVIQYKILSRISADITIQELNLHKKVLKDESKRYICNFR